MAWNGRLNGLIEDPTTLDAARIAEEMDRPYTQALAQLNAAQPRWCTRGCGGHRPELCQWVLEGRRTLSAVQGQGTSRDHRSTEEAAAPIHGKSVTYSWRDLVLFQQDVDAAIKSADPKDWATVIDPEAQTIFATVQATGAAKKASVRAAVAARVPRDVYSVTFISEPVSVPDGTTVAPMRRSMGCSTARPASR